MSDALRRVTPESRRRTKKACITCQTKKLKCNGLQPCATCSSRSNQCTYSPDGARLQAKHQARQSTASTQPSYYSNPTPQLSLPSPKPGNGNLTDSQLENNIRLNHPPLAPSRKEGNSEPSPQQLAQTQHQRQISQYPSPGINVASPQLPHLTEARSGGRPAAEASRSTSQGKDEKESLSEQSRMLLDGKGRLRDSASLSYLDTIRRLVESTLGPSEFTRDKHKQKILEGLISTARPTHVLPDREAAEFLVDSFFSNTVGIIYIFDREAFSLEVAKIYENPLQTEQPHLSILNLVFAVGLQATKSSSVHSFRESQILKRLDSGNTERAEMFYLNATHLNDPVSGFEDGDITSIQALLLITVFMLTIAKRNSAWAYLGMAVRSAYALGLHRNQTAFAFSDAEQRIRKNVWRSLYVMDCFLSAMLGRPNGINSRDAADFFNDTEEDLSSDLSSPSSDALELGALTASVGASCLVADILSNIYAERKISVKLAHQLSAKFQAWKNSLPPILHWQNISLPNEDPRITLAQLHVNLGYFHSIILLTRPFLLQRIINQIRAPSGSQTPRSETGSEKAEPFPGACVRSAFYSIDAVQSALLKRALPRRDPFVIYWLFAASLIIFSNGFCTVYSDIDNAHAMHTALNLHRYLAEVDPVARRNLQILNAFKDAIACDTIIRVAPTMGKAAGKEIFSAFFGGSQSGPSTGLGADRSMGNTIQATGMPPGADWHGYQAQGMCSSRPEMMMPPAADLTGTGISPPDYSLDFDAFLTSVNSDQAYAQDMWMPLYGTMGV
ncbi:hypothetical protein V500_03550 [Pseudogymnoascus sp. VKM F-4518 (FW-2643)]|nr:hypothetical protein V500_03550 [Pseudogymnoascus sp. VKM F-4518 (FW-2643)]